jgi:hypothetical protein
MLLNASSEITSGQTIRQYVSVMRGPKSTKIVRRHVKHAERRQTRCSTRFLYCLDHSPKSDLAINTFERKISESRAIAANWQLLIGVRVTRKRLRFQLLETRNLHVAFNRNP